MNENELAKIIVDAAIEVHRTMGGPGLLEAVYEDGEPAKGRGADVQGQAAGIGPSRGSFW